MEDFFFLEKTYEIFYLSSHRAYGAMKLDTIRRFVCEERNGYLRSEMGMVRLELTPRHSLCNLMKGSDRGRD
jgi:hypothetical protein